MVWSFPLAALASIPNFDRSNIASHDHYQITSDTYGSIWPWRSYKTSPHTPPDMEISRPHKKKLADGYVFLTPSDQKSKRGTYELSGTGYIMTEEGDLVFAGEENGYNFCTEWVAGMTDFRVQEYKGKPHLVYWNGCNTQGAHWGHRWGRVTFIDDEYTNFTVNPNFNVNTLDDVNRGQIDVHEHQMTDRDSMVVTTYNNTQTNLTSLGGAEDGWLAESMFTEFDIETEEVLFEWRAADHVPLEDSRWGLGSRGTRHLPWDWFHINSVQRIGENYLISARHHWALFFISGKDGSVIWKLDGIDGGSFGSIPTEFKWQHHARAQNVTKDGMTVTLFNNHVAGKQGKDTQSQALAFWLPLPASKDNPPVLVRNLMNDKDRVFAATQGSYQLDLGNGNGFVGYGKIPLAREFGPAGDGSDLRWQARFGKNDASMSYRTFKSPWHGTPKNWDPIVAFEKVRLQKARAPKVFVSWNGATDINAWAVYAGDDRESLKSVGVAKKKGFETTFDLEDANCVQVGAIRGGEIIRASNIACLEEVDTEPAMDLSDDSKNGGAVQPPEANPQLESELQRLEAEKEALDALKADLDAEKAALEAKVEELEVELEDAESPIWSQYKLAGSVACVVILACFGYWLYICFQDRRRSKYAHLDNFSPPRSLAETLRHNVFDRFGGRSQGFKDEEGKHNGPSPNDFELSEDEDEPSSTTARVPFIRQTTGR